MEQEAKEESLRGLQPMQIEPCSLFCIPITLSDTEIDKTALNDLAKGSSFPVFCRTQTYKKIRKDQFQFRQRPKIQGDKRVNGTTPLPLHKH